MAVDAAWTARPTGAQPRVHEFSLSDFVRRFRLLKGKGFVAVLQGARASAAAVAALATSQIGRAEC